MFKSRTKAVPKIPSGEIRQLIDLSRMGEEKIAVPKPHGFGALSLSFRNGRYTATERLPTPESFLKLGES